MRRFCDWKFRKSLHFVQLFTKISSYSCDVLICLLYLLLIVFGSIGRGFMKVGKSYLEPLIMNFCILGLSSCNKSSPLYSLVKAYKAQLNEIHEISNVFFNFVLLF